MTRAASWASMSQTSIVPHCRQRDTGKQRVKLFRNQHFVSFHLLHTYSPTAHFWWKYRRMVDEEEHNAEQQPSQSCFIFTLLFTRCSDVVSVVGYTTREPDGGNALSSATQHEHPSESSWAEVYYWAMMANFSCLPPCVNLMFPHHRRCSKVLEDVSLAVMMWDLECRS